MKRLIFASLAICIFSTLLFALDFNDGGVHELDHSVGSDEINGVRVDYEHPGMGTVLNVVNGASIAVGLYSHEDGRVNVSGGVIGGDGIYAYNNSIVNFSSGYTFDSGFNIYNNSQATLSGGFIGGDLYVETTALVNITGASINGELYANASKINISDGTIESSVWVENNSELTISGGNFNHRFNALSSFLNISGGSFTLPLGVDKSEVLILGGSLESSLYVGVNSHVSIYGGTVADEIRSGGNSKIYIYGNTFKVDGQPVGYGSLETTSGILTGNLQSGDLLDNYYSIWRDSIWSNAEIILVEAIPEPTTIALFAIGCLLLRRRK